MSKAEEVFLQQYMLSFQRTIIMMMMIDTTGKMAKLANKMYLGF